MSDSFMTPWTVALQDRILCPWCFPGKNTRVGCHSRAQTPTPPPPGARARLIVPRAGNSRAGGRLTKYNSAHNSSRAPRPRPTGSRRDASPGLGSSQPVTGRVAGARAGAVSWPQKRSGAGRRTRFYTILSYNSLILSSASVILLFVASRVFLISLIALFIIY